MIKKRMLFKNVMCIFIIIFISFDSFAAVVSDNDGSAFVTKAEFDALKNNFQKQINNYNTSIDSKIDGAIASYLSGIAINTTESYRSEFYSFLNGNSGVGILYNNQDTNLDPFQQFDAASVLSKVYSRYNTYESDAYSTATFTSSGKAGGEKAGFFRYYIENVNEGGTTKKYKILNGFWTSMKTLFSESDLRYSNKNAAMGGFIKSITTTQNNDAYTEGGVVKKYTDMIEPGEFYIYDSTSTANRKRNKNWMKSTWTYIGWNFDESPMADPYINKLPDNWVHQPRYRNNIDQEYTGYYTDITDEIDCNTDPTQPYETGANLTTMTPVKTQTYFIQVAQYTDWAGPMAYKTITGGGYRGIEDNYDFTKREHFKDTGTLTITNTKRSFYTNGYMLSSFFKAGNLYFTRGRNANFTDLTASFDLTLPRPKYETVDPTGTSTTTDQRLYNKTMWDFGVKKYVNEYCWPLVDLSNNNKDGSFSFTIKPLTYKGTFELHKIVNNVDTVDTMKVGGSSVTSLTLDINNEKTINVDLTKKAKYYIKWTPSSTITKNVQFATSDTITCVLDA